MPSIVLFFDTLGLRGLSTGYMPPRKDRSSVWSVRELELGHQLTDCGTLARFESACRLILEEAPHQAKCSTSITLCWGSNRVDWRCIFQIGEFGLTFAVTHHNGEVLSLLSDLGIIQRLAFGLGLLCGPLAAIIRV